MPLQLQTETTNVRRLAAVCGLLALLTAPALCHGQGSNAPSRSVGTCEDGELIGGVQLSPSTVGIKLLKVVRKRGTNWATARMTTFIAKTAQRLHAAAGHGTIPLRVGNLSQQRGGRIRWSHSHRAGRDVDLAFFAIGKRSGKPRAPDRFLYFNAQGEASSRGHRYLFDIDRNWRLVKTLLTDNTMHVARIYVAEPLRRLMLDHGREDGDAEWLLQRASHVMSEPSHAGKHNDHMHIRVFCSKAEVLAGCVDQDPPWPWTPNYSRARRQRVEELITALGNRDRDVRMSALSGLAPLHQRSEEATDGLVWVAAYDRSVSVRRRALAVLSSGASNWAFPSLIAAARRQRAPWRAFELLQTAIATATSADAAGLLGLLDCDRNPYRDRLSVQHFSILRRVVSRRVRPWLLERSLQPMLRVLDDPSATTRRAALRTLEHLANRRFANVQSVRAWYAKAAHFGRLHWMYDGFFRAGIPVEAPPHVLGPRLINLLRGPDEVLARNAEVLLTRVTGGVTLRYTQTPSRRYRAWQRWWSLNSNRFQWNRRHDGPRTHRLTLGDGPST